MPEPTRGTVSGLAGALGSRLRYPQLFTFVLVVFVLDLLIPDAIPFVDEILFGLLTVLLGSLRQPKAEDDPPPEKNVTPKRR